MINYGEKWEVLENISGTWENIGLSGIDLKYLKERAACEEQGNFFFFIQTAFACKRVIFI